MRIMQKTVFNYNMKLRYLLYIIMFACVGLSIASCKKDKHEEESELNIAEVSTKITGDKMFYGLTCDGTGDSSIIVYPMSGGDPLTFSCIEAHHDGRIIGKPQIGDWVGIVINAEDSTVADMVINLDQLKGTWTYPVLPVWKELKSMSKKMQKKMENKVLADIPDSVKALYFIPREYGFSLKRGHKAQSVGHVSGGTTVGDDSPVEYPAVKNYREWHMWNGRLILISQEGMALSGSKGKAPKEVLDTLDFVSLDEDSLVMTLHGVRYGFHRKESAITANKAAQKAAEKVEKKATEDLKK